MKSLDMTRFGRILNALLVFAVAFVTRVSSQPVSAPSPLSGASGSLPLPFILLHGVTESCSQSLYTRTESAIKAAIPGIYGYCMEIGNGALDSLTLPMMTQVQIICNQVRQDPHLAGGFNLLGFSQGGLLARGYIELCEGPPVNHFISLGGPQAGVASLPDCNPEPEFNALNFPCLILNGLGGAFIYTPVIQQAFAPTNYAIVPGLYDLYLEKSTYLPFLNNEHRGQQNEAFKQRFMRLNNLTLVLFSEDTVLIPVQTSWFGFYPPNNPLRVLPYDQTALYKEDWIGLQTLNAQGKVAFVTAPGAHLNITFKLLCEVILPALRPPGVPLLPPPPEVAVPAPSQPVGSSTMGP